jgi:hypothetical protein
MTRKVVALSLLSLLALSACDLSARDPRESVIKFLNAVKSADTLNVLRSFTMAAPYTLLSDTGLWPEGDARNDTIMAARLLAELSPEGAIYLRWNAPSRMVVGDVAVSGDTALVEVTRLDQSSGVNVYNKFGLVNKDGFWRIYSFGTQPGQGL